MDRALFVSVFLLLTHSGCKELTVAPSETGGNGGAGGNAGGEVGGSGGNVGGGGAGGGGGQECIPQADCSTGLLGACAMGQLSCTPTQMCLQTVQPAVERCDTANDENCDGKACVGDHVWSKRFGDSVNQHIEQILVDAQGNVVLVGRFEGVLDLGTTTLIGDDSSDSFVAKFDSSGALVWAKAYVGTGWQAAFTAALAPNGDIVIAGAFEQQITIGSSATALPDGGGDIFIAKIDAQGNPLWLYHVPGTDYQGLYGITVDPNGDVIAVGETTGQMDFKSGPEMVAGEYDVLIIKLSPTGNEQWHRLIGSPSYDAAWTVATDKQSNIYLAGETFGTLDFNGGVVAADAFGDGYLVKLDPMGSHLWSKPVSSTGEQWGSSVACDADDNVIFMFEYQGTVNMGGQALAGFPSVGETGIAKFDSSGAHLWSRRLYNSGNKFGHFSAVPDALGNILIAGSFDGGIDFGNAPLSATGKSLVVAKLDFSSKHIWSHAFGTTTGKIEPYNVAAGLFGELFTTGSLEGSVNFGAGPLTSAGVKDAFVVRFSP